MKYKNRPKKDSEIFFDKKLIFFDEFEKINVNFSHFLKNQWKKIKIEKNIKENFSNYQSSHSFLKVLKNS